MSERDNDALVALLQRHEAAILDEWLREQSASRRRGDPAQDAEARTTSRELLAAIAGALAAGGGADIAGAPWEKVRDILAELSARRANQGYSASDTATLLFALKQPLFRHLREDVKDAGKFADALWRASTVVDSLGLHATEMYQKTREQVIERQQRELLELSTPVVELWEGILALPLIGTLDSGRTQVVMESLLEKIVESGASIAIIDITGVPTVDTLVAQHLMKTVAAARLMGADCIISGIRPQIAQTIVHLGVDLAQVTTKASLADAFLVALKRTGSEVHLRQAQKG
ncbi:MAG TPA: STAS domain-containing protein [Usitatibacter sp.]|nr:STAS domain-containing protein [Usitatibacter sp.]